MANEEQVDAAVRCVLGALILGNTYLKADMMEVNHTCGVHVMVHALIYQRM